MAKRDKNEVTLEGNTSDVTPSEKKSEAVKVTQSTKEVEVEVIKDFKGLKAGDKVIVSANVAELLTIKGLVK